MAIDQKLPLILRLFPTFKIASQEMALNRLLQISGIVSMPDNTLTLPDADRARQPHRNQVWLRAQIHGYGGRLGTMFVWAHKPSLLAEVSALNTLELFIHEMRGIRKVLVVGDDLWKTYADEAGIPPNNPSFENSYQSVREDGASEYGTCYVLHLRSLYELDDGYRLGAFAGTRRPTGTNMVAPSRSRREDETVTTFAIESETRLAPPGVGPVDPFARPEREDPTQPK